jgi:membrane protein YqaA with SNARE-associated domain
VKYTVLPATILAIYLTFTFASGQGYVPTGLELLESLRSQVDEHWFWLVVFCIFLEALVVISLYFPGQYIAALLVILSGPTLADIIMLSIAMVIATTLGSAVNYGIGRYLSKEPKGDVKPISYKTLLPALVHSSGLAIFTFNWGLQRGTAKLITISAILNTPYYLLIMFTTVTFGEEIIAATDNPLIIGSALGIWLVISLYRDWKQQGTMKTV